VSCGQSSNHSHPKRSVGLPLARPQPYSSPPSLPAKAASSPAIGSSHGRVLAPTVPLTRLFVDRSALAAMAAYSERFGRPALTSLQQRLAAEWRALSDTRASAAARALPRARHHANCLSPSHDAAGSSTPTATAAPARDVGAAGSTASLHELDEGGDNSQGEEDGFVTPQRPPNSGSGRCQRYHQRCVSSACGGRSSHPCPAASAKRRVQFAP
jgi:hypothetical protein